MHSKIPLPTDNIYKFYAMFGLLLVISSMLSAVYVSNKTFDSGFALVKEYEKMTTTELDSTPLTTRLIETQIKNLGSNKTTQLLILGGLIGIGLVVMIIGFWQWHTIIQPKHDKLLDLQIRKLEKELE